MNKSVVKRRYFYDSEIKFSDHFERILSFGKRKGENYKISEKFKKIKFCNFLRKKDKIRRSRFGENIWISAEAKYLKVKERIFFHI